MNTAIVTIKTQSGVFERDMELPTNLPVSQLTDKLIEVLKFTDYQTFKNMDRPILVCDGKVPDPKKTLDELVIWDGSIIEVRQKEE